MRFIKYSTEQSFAHLAKQSLADISGQTPLQLRHHLKENWDNFIQLSEERGSLDEINHIIYNNLFRDIKQISNTKPSAIEVENIPQLKLEKIEKMYKQIVDIIAEHKKVTMYALCWATLCNNNKKDKMGLYEYLDRENDAARILEVFALLYGDELNEAEGSLENWLNKLGLSVSKERGLIHVITGAGKHIIDLFKYMFQAWWTKSEEDKNRLKEHISTTKITKADIFDVLEKIDTLTLNIFSGPLHVLEVVTGWKITANLETKKDTTDIKSRISNAIKQLKDVMQNMPKKVAKKFHSYLRGLENTVCGDLGICSEDKNGKIKTNSS